MQVRDGPAAVIGDENRKEPLSGKSWWEGAASRVIRESEDLPGEKPARDSEPAPGHDHEGMKKGHSRIALWIGSGVLPGP